MSCFSATRVSSTVTSLAARKQEELPGKVHEPEGEYDVGFEESADDSHEPRPSEGWRHVRMTADGTLVPASPDEVEAHKAGEEKLRDEAQRRVDEQRNPKNWGPPTTWELTKIATAGMLGGAGAAITATMAITGTTPDAVYDTSPANGTAVPSLANQHEIEAHKALLPIVIPVAAVGGATLSMLVAILDVLRRRNII